MGTILCSAIVDKAELQLMDTGNNRHEATDLFGWLKSGQRQAAILKPDVSVTNVGVALSAGVKQTIPTGGLQIIDITHNLGVGGATPGAAIDIITMKTMSALNPDWASDTAAAVVENFMLDERDPKNFYVYPAQPAGVATVNMVYSVTPADPATIATAITLDDIYETLLLDYVLYRAYGKDSAQSQFAAARSMAHWNFFVEALGRKDLKEKTDHPRPNKDEQS
jgi:hypothetical protein